MTAESFDGLVDRIYEAAVVPELWPAVFEDMACLTESAFGSMYAMRAGTVRWVGTCLLYTSPSPRDRTRSRMPSSA